MLARPDKADAEWLAGNMLKAPAAPQRRAGQRVADPGAEAARLLGAEPAGTPGVEKLPLTANWWVRCARFCSNKLGSVTPNLVCTGRCSGALPETGRI